MKNISLAIIAILVLSSCQQQKIGYVDNAKIFDEYQEIVDTKKKLQDKLSDFEKRKDSLAKSFQLEINEAEIKARKMSTSNKQKLGQELQQKDQVLAQRIQFEEQQLAQHSQKLNDSLKKKVNSFIEGYGKTNGYQFILGTNEATGSVIYGEEKSNITNTVLEALNASYNK